MVSLTGILGKNVDDVAPVTNKLPFFRVETPLDTLHQ